MVRGPLECSARRYLNFLAGNTMGRSADHRGPDLRSDKFVAWFRPNSWVWQLELREMPRGGLDRTSNPS